MKVIANTQIYGVYGIKTQGEAFEVDDKLGRQLLEGGKVRKATPSPDDLGPMQPDQVRMEKSGGRFPALKKC